MAAGAALQGSQHQEPLDLALRVAVGAKLQALERQRALPRQELSWQAL